MTATVVGGDAAASGNVTTVTCTIPSGTLDGDLGLMCIAWGSAQTLTAPSGWTQLGTTQNFSGSSAARFYRRSMLTTDAGDALTSTVNVASRQSIGVVVVRGVDDPQQGFTLAQTSTATTSHSNPTVTSLTGTVVSIGLFVVRGSSLDAAIGTLPSGYTLIDQAWGTSNGACAAVLAHNLTPDTDGTVGGGNWVCSTNQISARANVAITVTATVPNDGDATGTWTFTGTGTGSRPAAGTATGSFTYSGSAFGKQIPAATGSGTLTYTGTAAGLNTRSGTGTGTLTYVGTGAGQRTTTATATGTLAYVGTAAGRRTTTATGTGTTVWTGVATGGQGRAGSSSGSFTYTGTATGKREPEASSSGTFTYVGTAAGTAPTVPIKTGSSSGTLTYLGTAEGKRVARGLAFPSDVTWTSSVTGKRPAGATASGTLTYLGTAHGLRRLTGHATGTWAYLGTAIGIRPIIPRDITFTGHLAHRHGTGRVLTRSILGTIGHDGNA